MDVSKFIIDGNEVNVKDAEGRNLIAALSEDVTAAQNTADGAQSAADDAQGTANDALNGLAVKQDLLTKWGNFTGNIDELYADSGDTYQNNGVYFCGVDSVTGTLPFTSTGSFFTLVVLKNIQIAFPYKTPATDTSDATVKFRDHTNGWRLWRGASFTV